MNTGSAYSRPFTFDRVVRLLIGCAVVVFLVWLVNLLKDVLLPFCVACLIAYIFEPFVQYNRKLLKLKGRIVAIFVTLFEVLVFIGIMAYFTIPMIIDEVRQMAALLEHVVLAVAGWLMVLLYVVFIMLDYERLMNGFRLLVPPRARPLAYKLGNDIKDSMNHYFRGQALMAVCVAFIYCVGFYLCDLPLAILLGLGTGVLFMIPYFQFLTIIPVTLLCLVGSVDGTSDFWGQWWSCMMVFAVVQVVADLILMPRIMGKAMGLNPAIILLSLSIWGTLFGMIGMIIALPLTTLLLSYYDQYIIRPDGHPSSAGSPTL